MNKPWTDAQKRDFHFKEQYSRFKIWFGMKDKINRTYYGIEVNCTVLQIASGRVTEVVFDKKKGYENCLYLERKYRDLYETAIIYQKKGTEWVEMKKYRYGHLAESVEVDLSNAITVAMVIRDEQTNWSLKRIPKTMIRAPDERQVPKEAPKPVSHKSEVQPVADVISRMKQKWNITN